MNKRVRKLLQEYGREKVVEAKGNIVIGKDGCPFCVRTYALLEALSIPYTKYSLGKVPPHVLDAVTESTGQNTVPIIYLGKDHIGGFNDLVVHMSRIIGEVVNVSSRG